MILRRIARPLLASAFVASGVDAIRSPKPIAQSAEPVVDKARSSLPPEVAGRIPENTETLVQINAAAQIGGGILLATGKFPRVASVVLAGTLIPTTAAGTDFWNEADPVRQKAQRDAFIRNMGLLGGVLLAAVDTEGKPSLVWRGRHKASAVAAALPIGAAAGSSTWDTIVERTHDGAEVVGERSAEAGELLSKGAHLVSERSADAAAKFREHAPEIAEAAQKRSLEIAEKAAGTAAEVADRLRDRAPVLADAALERSSTLADAALGRSSELAETARKRGPKLAKKAQKRAEKAQKQAKKNAPKIADAARDRAAELAEAARERSADARKRAPLLADVARDRTAELAEIARARSAELAETARQLAAVAEETADESRKRLRKARR
ncbi:DoxX family membrane protein [Gordonia jinghuaiqii]|uniref:DoxX family membrane protein n=1 Tax=Gordonia jinghuaiqii TaxID=2758710 RepID=A0A7D7RMQ4_9ACTN|nr:DoxX family protein [Gordonia jinghuaiqii]MCR5977414.1 DoxX family membrane protein [Gordonia jinghuaiqii]QMT00013.1 DoxX family membrane protein [Gordonia jinghuaiqii]